MVFFIYVFSIVTFIGGSPLWLTLIHKIHTATGSDVLSKSMICAWFLLLLVPFIFHYYSGIKDNKNKTLGIEKPINKTSRTVLFVLGGLIIIVSLPMFIFFTALFLGQFF